MAKSKIFLDDSLEFDGINVYKKDKLFYTPLINDERIKFSLLILYARNFDIDRFAHVLRVFSLDCIYEKVAILSKEDFKKYHLRLAEFDMKVATCPDPEDVLYASLKAGLRAISARTDFIILHFGNLSDVSRETLNRICNFTEASKSEIVIPTFDEAKGHPIVFNKNLLPQLMSLRKEKGLPYLLKKFSDEISTISVSDMNILRKNTR
jgi:molybdenum cofactor cytidylyltransferase